MQDVVVALAGITAHLHVEGGDGEFVPSHYHPVMAT